jgi:L-arabinose isomerase
MKQMPVNLKPKVGILGLTLDFYENNPKIREGRDAWVRKAVLPALASQVRPLYHGAVFQRAAIEAEVRRLEREGAEVLMVVLLTYSTSLSSLQALLQTRLPIVIWNTQELYSVDENYGIQELIANHGVHGTFDLSNVLVRSGVRFWYHTSHITDPGAMDQLSGVLKAATGVTAFRNLRLGVLGFPFPGMGDFGLDTTFMTASLGCSVESLSMGEYHGHVARAPKAAVAKLVATYRQSYRLNANVKAEDLAATARAEWALRALIEAKSLDAYSYQFLAFENDSRAETVPFVAATRLLGEGIGFGGEGDLIAAAFATVLNRIAHPATFTEIFTIDFAGNGLMLAHMGESNIAMARKDRPVELRQRGPIVKTRYNQLVLPVFYEPGPATLAVLTLVDHQRWRIIASPVEVADFGPLPQADTPQTKVVVRQDVRDWLNAYGSAGGPHHMAMCFGDACGQLKVLAHLLGADFVVI